MNIVLLKNGAVVQVWRAGTFTPRDDYNGDVLETQEENICAGMHYDGKTFFAPAIVKTPEEIAEEKREEKKQEILQVASITDQINLLGETLANLVGVVMKQETPDVGQLTKATAVFLKIQEIRTS